MADFDRHHHYSSIARNLADAHQPHEKLKDKIEPVVRCFCQYADEKPDGFAYCMLSQHGYLERFGDNADNPVQVLCDLVADAIKCKEIPAGDATALAAMSIGIVLQPATFRLYGRINKPLEIYVPVFAKAVEDVLFRR